MRPRRTEITTSWISEIEGSPNSVEVSFASIASQSDEVSVVTMATVDVVPEHAVSTERGVEETRVDARSQPGLERTEDRAAHPDRGRDQHEEPGESLE